MSVVNKLSQRRRSARFEYQHFDSSEDASCNRSDIDRDPTWCCAIGSDTVDLIEHKRYFVNGVCVDLAGRLDAQRMSTLDLPPEVELPEFSKRFHTTKVEVRNQTQTEAARIARHGVFRVLTVMPTDGNQPGGRLLAGGRGTEEFLCRSTTILASIADRSMYPFHRQFSPEVATDWAILCPGVSVVREDDGTLIASPWAIDVLAMCPPKTHDVKEVAIYSVLRQRFLRMFSIAAAFGYDRVILPPFATGVYGTNPQVVADAMAEILVRPFRGTFDRIVFASPDWSPDRRYSRPFHKRFSQLQTV